MGEFLTNELISIRSSPPPNLTGLPAYLTLMLDLLNI